MWLYLSFGLFLILLHEILLSDCYCVIQIYVILGKRFRNVFNTKTWNITYTFMLLFIQVCFIIVDFKLSFRLLLQWLMMTSWALKVWIKISFTSVGNGRIILRHLHLILLHSLTKLCLYLISLILYYVRIDHCHLLFLKSSNPYSFIIFNWFLNRNNLRLKLIFCRNDDTVLFFVTYLFLISVLLNLLNFWDFIGISILCPFFLSHYLCLLSLCLLILSFGVWKNAWTTARN